MTTAEQNLALQTLRQITQLRPEWAEADVTVTAQTDSAVYSAVDRQALAEYETHLRRDWETAVSHITGRWSSAGNGATGASLRDWVAHVTQAAGSDAGAPLPLKPVEAPSRAVLQRISLSTEAVLPTERITLALAAEDLLGYTPLREATLPGAVHTRLQRALAKLEIEPLEERSVDAYKAQMVQHYHTMNKMEQPTWRLHALADYALPIPEFVLRKAVAIKRELPDAQFYVDQLAVDPFLIVCVAGEELADWNVNRASRELDTETQAYIEVWDEPKFEEAL
jgi:hypothetical protein